MNVLIYLVPLALMLGLTGLVAFLWSLKSGQYDDLDGAAVRILPDDDIASHTIASHCLTPRDLRSRSLPSAPEGRTQCESRDRGTFAASSRSHAAPHP